jgi:hypothetical protein
MWLARDHKVRSFPFFDDERWHLLLFGVKELLPHLTSKIPPSVHIEIDDNIRVVGSEDISFTLSVVAVMDFETRRMWLSEGDDSGREFAEEFRWFLEEMLGIAERITGFLEH